MLLGPYVFKPTYPLSFGGNPMPILKNKTPYDILFMESSSFDRNKFWVLVYAHHNQKKKDKFDSRTRQCIFVGYPFAKRGWKVYDLITNEIFISRDVLFHEDQFPFHTRPKKKNYNNLLMGL